MHPSQYTLVQKTGETILHLAQLGYVIIVGRASNIITAKMPGGVHIRLVSPLGETGGAYSGILSNDEKKAKEFILTEDRKSKELC